MTRNPNVIHELTAELDGKPLFGRILAVGHLDRDEKRDQILDSLPGVVVIDYNTDTGREIRWSQLGYASRLLLGRMPASTAGVRPMEEPYQWHGVP